MYRNLLCPETGRWKVEHNITSDFIFYRHLKYWIIALWDPTLAYAYYVRRVRLHPQPPLPTNLVCSYKNDLQRQQLSIFKLFMSNEYTHYTYSKPFVNIVLKFITVIYTCCAQSLNNSMRTETSCHYEPVFCLNKHRIGSSCATLNSGTLPLSFSLIIHYLCRFTNKRVVNLSFFQFWHYIAIWVVWRLRLCYQTPLCLITKCRNSTQKSLRFYTI